jgi:hypothetical protein
MARLVLRLIEPARVTALMGGRAYFGQLQSVDAARFRGDRYQHH